MIVGAFDHRQGYINKFNCLRQLMYIKELSTEFNTKLQSVHQWNARMPNSLNRSGKTINLIASLSGLIVLVREAKE